MKAISSLVMALATFVPLLPVAAGAEPGSPSTHRRSDDASTCARFHNPLNAILVFVYDRASADAAAPRVKALMENPGGQELSFPVENSVLLCDKLDCFGSTALQAEMPAVTKQKMTPGLRLFRERCLPHLDALDDAAQAYIDKLQSVKNESGAAKVAESLKGYPAVIEKHTQQMALAMMGATLDEAEQIQCSIIVRMRNLMLADRLLHAYAHAQRHRKGGFPKLEKAFKSHCAAMHLGEEMMAQVNPAKILAHEKLARACGEWLTLAATITDKESADAAADWLEKKSAQLGKPLGTVWKEVKQDAQHPCTSWLSAIMEHADTYIRHATPAYFGSEKLRVQLTTAQVKPMRNKSKKKKLH